MMVFMISASFWFAGYGPSMSTTRRKEHIADACTGHYSAVSLIKYGVVPIVSMVWHGSCISAHGAAMRWTRYAFHSRAVSRHGRAVPQYFYVVRTTIFNLAPTPTCNAIWADSKEMLIELSNDSGILSLWIRHVQTTRTFQSPDDLAANIQLLYETSHLNYTTVPSIISYFIQKELKKTNLCRYIEWASTNRIVRNGLQFKFVQNDSLVRWCIIVV